MTDYKTIWQFKTKQFRVELACMPESRPDLSWADAETIEKLDNGTYVNVCFRVSVYWRDALVGRDYLGNSVYENVADFRDHVGSKDKWGSYFTDMVREAIRETRTRLHGAPQLRGTTQ